MSFNFRDLDEATRKFMLKEIEHDFSLNRIYRSNRLTDEGSELWVNLLKEAAQSHDEIWLAQALDARRAIKMQEPRTTRGNTTMVKVPANAAHTLVEGEFNRFYIRGLCQRAINEGTVEVYVYRAKHSAQPRDESTKLIGKTFHPKALLEDLRNSIGVDAVLGLPPGPNSGLSASLRK